MKKLLLSLAVSACLVPALATAGNLHGVAEGSASVAHVNGGLPNADSQSASFMLNLDSGHKLGAGISHVNAWDEHSRYFSVRAITPLSKNLWVDTEIGGSDQGLVTPRQRLASTVNFAVPEYRLVLASGFDVYELRQAGTVRSFKASGSYTVPTLPLVVDADLMYTRGALNRDFNVGGSYRAGVGMTYGKVGQWTVSGRLDSGRAHFDLETPPGIVADFDSTHVGAGARYWVEKDWGLNTSFSHVNNRYFARNQVQAGVFYHF